MSYSSLVSDDFTAYPRPEVIFLVPLLLPSFSFAVMLLQVSICRRHICRLKDLQLAHLQLTRLQLTDLLFRPFAVDSFAVFTFAVGNICWSRFAVKHLLLSRNAVDSSAAQTFGSPHLQFFAVIISQPYLLAHICSFGLFEYEFVRLEINLALKLIYSEAFDLILSG